VSIGGGHGNFFPVLVSAAPFAFVPVLALVGAPFLWALVGALVADPGRIISPRAVLWVHYASAVAQVMVFYRSGHPEDMMRVGSGIVPWAIVYLAGQVVIWRQIQLDTTQRKRQ
jgi:hypothetical protein